MTFDKADRDSLIKRLKELPDEELLAVLQQVFAGRILTGTEVPIVESHFFLGNATRLYENTPDGSQAWEPHVESIQFQPITAVGERFVAYGAVLRRATASNVEHFIAILRRFNEQVDTLLGLSFVQHIREREKEAKRWEARTYNRRKRSKWKFSFVQSLVKRRNEAKIRAAHAANDQYLSNAIALGPSSEATAAFVLAMRSLIDDTEECSLENVTRYYQSATIGTKHASRYLANRNVFAIALDAVTELVDREQVVDTDGNVIGRIDKPLTQRQVFDICLYGDSRTPSEPKNSSLMLSLATPRRGLCSGRALLIGWMRIAGIWTYRGTSADR